MIEKILTHLGLQARAPRRSPSRTRRCRRPERAKLITVRAACRPGPGNQLRLGL